MSEQDGNEREERPGGLARWSRVTSFWALVLLLSMAALSVRRGGQQSVADLSYTEFIRQVDAENVLEMTVTRENGKIVGELRRPINRDGNELSRFTSTLTGDLSEETENKLLQQGTDIQSEADSDAWWTLLVGILPWILFAAFWLWIFRTMQGGGNRAFQFGRSKAKLLSPDTPKLTFQDVAGADEAKEELAEIIDFLKDPGRFSRLGGRLPTGVLLVGPPGTGKTLLAKAVAGEAARPFFQMSGSDFVEMFVGVGASRVRDLFEQGKAHAPCIIFIDEIDAVGRHRGAGLGGGHDEREQTLNQLLVEMDGFETNEGVILLAATNRPDVLDPALLRPGRFDRQVVVDLPDVKGREAILRVHAKKLPLGDDVDLEIIAKGTPGMSGADLANVCNEAALLAARRGTDYVMMEDFESAKDKVMLGAERKSMVLTEAERRLTAFHEAGHAVIGLRHPGLDPVHKITIVPRGRALGITASLPEEDRHSYTKEWLEGRLIMLFGGRVAEEIVFGPEKVTTGAGNDIERATATARRMVTSFGMSEAVGLMAVGDSEHEVFIGRELVQRRHISEYTAELVDKEVRRILDEAYETARGVINGERDLLDAIAEALLERETLDRDEIELLAAGESLPPVQPASDEEPAMGAVAGAGPDGAGSDASDGREGAAAPALLDTREPAPEGGDR